MKCFSLSMHDTKIEPWRYSHEDKLLLKLMRDRNYSKQALVSKRGYFSVGVDMPCMKGTLSLSTSQRNIGRRRGGGEVEEEKEEEEEL